VSRKKYVRRKAVDSRQVGPIAYVVDSSGTPVTHWWTPVGKKKPIETKIGIYWQETSLPDSEKGIHTVWSSDENFGDTYPWKRGTPQSEMPKYLVDFMDEASGGQLSGTYALTDWGRDCAAQRCKCRTGGPLLETKHDLPKKDERGGLNSRQWKQYQHKLKTGKIV